MKHLKYLEVAYDPDSDTLVPLVYESRVVTDPDFWDCDCDGDPEVYIHPKSERVCPRCRADYDAHPEYFPDSRVDEIPYHLFLLGGLPNV